MDRRNDVARATRRADRALSFVRAQPMSARVHTVIAPERAFAANERQQPTGTFAPTGLAERSEWLDALRGFALFGVLIYNMMTFSGYVFRKVLLPVHNAWSALDPSLDYLVHALVEGKFYSLFSFLFGLGFALQMRRAEAIGGEAMSALRRRLAWLLVFGLAHALLIWFGDILTVYAVFGFVLLLWFRRMSQRALLAWALSFLAMPVLIYLVFLAFRMGDPLGPATPGATGESLLGKAVRAMATGSYVDVLQTNALFYPGGWLRRGVRLMLPRIFGMFLLGMWVCRAGLPILRDAHRPMLRRWLLWGVLLGLPLNAIYAALGSGGALLPASTTGLLVITSASLGIPLSRLRCRFRLVLAPLASGQPSRHRRPHRAQPVSRTKHRLRGLVLWIGLRTVRAGQLWHCAGNRGRGVRAARLAGSPVAALACAGPNGSTVAPAQLRAPDAVDASRRTLRIGMR
jgi:uncharacterized protein